MIDLANTATKLLAIVANKRGANDAVAFEEITYLGYPFSISETFQMRNTNATIAQSLDRVKTIQEICVANRKQMVVYISMRFGNPYGDEWNVEIVQHWVEQLAALDIRIFQLSDTVGVAKKDSIAYLFSQLIPVNPGLEIGSHFHTTSSTWAEKVSTAYENGCRRFDGVIKGFGGCPMAQDSLVGNMPSEHLIQFAQANNHASHMNMDAYRTAMVVAEKIMNYN